MTTSQQLDVSSLMGTMITFMIVVMMMRMMTKVIAEPGPKMIPPGKIEPGYRPIHHSSVRRYGEPRTEAERTRVHEEFYGTGKLPPRGTGLSERGESVEARRSGRPKTEAERGETHRGRYGTSKLPERGSGLEHYSIHGPERKELIDQYGTWAVGRAESVCPEDDVECVRREAARLLQAYRGG